MLITHYHGDHIGGLRNKAGEFVFAKAKVMVPAPEHAFWMDDAKMAAAPEGMKGAFNNVRRVFAQMPADMLVRFEPGSEVAPGIRSVAAFGHTPGHTLFEVTLGRPEFVYVGDLTNVPALFARNPDWAVTFDMDAEAARKVRRETFQRIVASNAMVGGFHFPFPAFGRMVAGGPGLCLPAGGLTARASAGAARGVDFGSQGGWKMRREFKVAFGPAGSVTVDLPAGEQPWAPDVGRRWLEDQFIANECEPLRASGKVLSADKVLAVATALGLQRLQQEEQLRSDFARATLGALGRPLVRVDVESGAITF